MRTSLLVATFVACIVMLGDTVDAQVPRAGGTSVAVIDINFIFKHHLRFKQAMDDIKKEIEGFEAHLRDERSKIAAQTEQLKNLPAGSDEYRNLETMLANQHTQLQLETARKRKEILDREAKVYFNAYREIEDYVAQFANRNGIGLVLRFSSEEMDPTKRESVLQGVNRPVVYQNSLNITHYVLDELNRGTPQNRTSNSVPPIPGRASR